MFDIFRKKPETYYKPETFAREYLGEIMDNRSDAQFRRAYRAWLSYFDRCEKFDQKTCRARNSIGLAVPQGTDEMGLCNQNARLLKQELLEPLKAFKIPRETEDSAKDLAWREHERKWQKKS